jgi:hypothetical protein
MKCPQSSFINLSKCRSLRWHLAFSLVSLALSTCLALEPRDVSHHTSVRSRLLSCTLFGYVKCHWESNIFLAYRNHDVLVMRIPR